MDDERAAELAERGLCITSEQIKPMAILTALRSAAPSVGATATALAELGYSQALHKKWELRRRLIDAAPPSVKGGGGQPGLAAWKEEAALWHALDLYFASREQARPVAVRWRLLVMAREKLTTLCVGAGQSPPDGDEKMYEKDRQFAETRQSLEEHLGRAAKPYICLSAMISLARVHADLGERGKVKMMLLLLLLVPLLVLLLSLTRSLSRRWPSCSR